MKENHEEKLFDELSKIYEASTGHKLPPAKIYNTGENVFLQGNLPKGIYYIKNGTIIITRNDHDNPVVVRLARKHEFIGYLSLLKRWDYDSTATTIEPAEIVFIPKEIFLKELDNSIKFANFVLNILCAEIDSKNELLTEMLTRKVHERLAVLLLMLDSDPRDGKINVLKKHIASILNIKAETLSRNLIRLQKLGLIKLHAKTNIIEILSRQKLLELAHIQD